MSLRWAESERQGEIPAAGKIETIREQFGDVSLPTEVKEGVNLETEWTKQAEKLATLFAGELRQTEEEYCASLPKFAPQPEAFKGRFDIPVLVETRIPVKRQCELAGIDYYLGGLEVRDDWSEDSEGYKTPKKPYATWIQDGADNLEKRVEKVRKELEKDERGGTVFDGIALFLAHPEILEDHFIDLPGTQVGSNRAPSLHLWRERPGLGYHWVGVASPGFGSVSCGRS